MSNPNQDKLSTQQVLTRVFDNNTERLRVDSVASIEAGQMSIDIAHTEDSIKIGDGTDFLAVNADGSINVSGVSTAANQVTGNTSLSNIDSKLSASTSATPVAVVSSATSVILLASNSSRKAASFYNDSTAILYLKTGTTASSSSYTVQIPPQGYFELPINYTGRIDGIWVSANGNCLVTEYT